MDNSIPIPTPEQFPTLDRAILKGYDQQQQILHVRGAKWFAPQALKADTNLIELFIGCIYPNNSIKINKSHILENCKQRPEEVDWVKLTRLYNSLNGKGRDQLDSFMKTLTDITIERFIELTENQIHLPAPFTTIERLDSDIREIYCEETKQWHSDRDYYQRYKIYQVYRHGAHFDNPRVLPLASAGTMEQAIAKATAFLQAAIDDKNDYAFITYAETIGGYDVQIEKEGCLIGVARIQATPLVLDYLWLRSARNINDRMAEIDEAFKNPSTAADTKKLLRLAREEQELKLLKRLTNSPISENDFIRSVYETETKLGIRRSAKNHLSIDLGL